MVPVRDSKKGLIDTFYMNNNFLKKYNRSSRAHAQRCLLSTSERLGWHILGLMQASHVPRRTQSNHMNTSKRSKLCI